MTHTYKALVCFCVSYILSSHIVEQGDVAYLFEPWASRTLFVAEVFFMALFCWHAALSFKDTKNDTENT